MPSVKSLCHISNFIEEEIFHQSHKSYPHSRDEGCTGQRASGSPQPATVPTGLGGEMQSGWARKGFPGPRRAGAFDFGDIPVTLGIYRSLDLAVS